MSHFKFSRKFYIKVVHLQMFEHSLSTVAYLEKRLYSLSNKIMRHTTLCLICTEQSER